MLVPCDPAAYSEAMREMERSEQGVSLPFRQRMAAQAFARTSRYDATIAAYLERA